MYNKKAQQEMVGFILIVVLVIVAIMVYLVISIGQTPEERNNPTTENLLTSIMRHTTSCAIVNEPNYDNFEELFLSCEKNSLCKNLNENSCSYLEESLKSLLNFTISQEKTINFYSFEYGPLDSEKKIIKSLSNCTGEVSIARESITSVSGPYSLKLTTCSLI